MVNIIRLKGALQDKGITIEQASEALNINPATFYRRLNKQGEKFTVSEVGKLAEMLKMDSKTMQDIFFEN